MPEPAPPRRPEAARDPVRGRLVLSAIVLVLVVIALIWAWSTYRSQADSGSTPANQSPSATASVKPTSG